MDFNYINEVHHVDIYPRGHRIEVEILSFEGTLIIITVLQSLALLSSIVRLVHRALIRKLWWDDMWAAVAFFTDTALFTVFLLLMVPKNIAASMKDLLAFSRWVTLLTYTTALWASRLTISVTITRLLPPCTTRTVSKAASVLFGVFFSIMFFEKIFFCGTNWHNQAECTIPRYVGIIELVTDNLADLWLILAPVYMLFHMKLRSVHHRLILAIFTCGLFTMLASITHSVFILINSPAWVGISADIQVTIAIIVSNLLVIVTGLYRALRRGQCQRRANHVYGIAHHADRVFRLVRQCEHRIRRGPGREGHKFRRERRRVVHCIERCMRREGQ
ncbi:hypothetical protein HYPSUDRAFT_981809 [Hypholoma sublateritium FD-334 SS-4]|uniref:Rhodopsin domain-containing protein n=1 Tax=Hypholoma sublateritium (strain FD-334 SS-4) TaxID=945553 RepID=A0A0D2Q627_HYPSF|nr:hypothetical protein HYPSUDRAFT_981809 [Hypholoma sublateritium FD-334 SS-4]